MKKIDKAQFRLSLEKLPQSPIKKSYDYYKHFGNSWNSKYLSSPKVAKYYIDPHELFLSSPAGPLSLSIQESTERTQRFEAKAAKSKLESRQRLLDRKKERNKIQAKSKQLAVKLSQLPRATQSSTPKRPYTQNFGVNKVQIEYNKFRTLSNREREVKLEPILLTQKNYSENDAVVKRSEERNSARQKSVRISMAGLRSVVENELSSGSKKMEFRNERICWKRLQVGADKNKVKEILDELETFEREYAQRLMNRSDF